MSLLSNYSNCVLCTLLYSAYKTNKFNTNSYEIRTYSSWRVSQRYKTLFFTSRLDTSYALLTTQILTLSKPPTYLIEDSNKIILQIYAPNRLIISFNTPLCYLLNTLLHVNSNNVIKSKRKFKAGHVQFLCESLFHIYKNNDLISIKYR